MNFKGQTTVELSILIIVSLLALVVVFSLYLNQMESASVARDSSMAHGTIQRLVSAANSLYLGGAGSKTRVLMEVPDSAVDAGSDFSGRVAFLRIGNNSDIIGTADVNFLGNWKHDSGGLVKGAYFATLYYDGNVVHIYYSDFDLSTEGVYVSLQQGSSVQESINVRNNSLLPAHFWVSKSFSHSDVNLILDPDDGSFSLAPDAIRSVDFNFLSGPTAQGNYAGEIVILGSVNDGYSDINISKTVIVSVEAFLPLGSLALFPKTTSYPSSSPGSSVRSFSLCNKSPNDILGVEWSKAGSGAGSNNASTWFDTTSLPDTVSAGDCNSFNLTISVPPDVTSGVHDANLIAVGDSNSTTAFISINVAG